MKYALILVFVYTGSGVATTVVPGFDDLELCQYAGKKAFLDLSAPYRDVRFSCVETSKVLDKVYEKKKK